MKFEQLSDDRMPDETNEKIQRDFLKGLVRRLRKEPVITEWTVKTPVVEEVASMDSKGDEQDPFHLMGASVLLDYLRENSLGHMIGSA